MDGPSGSVTPRTALLIVSVLAAAIISFQAIRLCLADYRVRTDRIDQLERGAALEPANASAWDRLGRVRLTDFENPDPAGAVRNFQKALELDPLSADYWMDLAGAYETTGNIPLARAAFDRARAVYPASAQVARIYGNFLLRQDEIEQRFARINHKDACLKAAATTPHSHNEDGARRGQPRSALTRCRGWISCG